jgi:hypothetical protein
VRGEPQHDHASATTKTKMHVPLNGFSHCQNNVPFAITMLGFASSPPTYMSARNLFKVLRRLAVRNEPQHDHASATTKTKTKTKIHAPLIGFSHSPNIVPFAITMLGFANTPPIYMLPISFCMRGKIPIMPNSWYRKVSIKKKKPKSAAE